MAKKKTEQPPDAPVVEMEDANKSAAFDVIAKQQGVVDDWKQKLDKDAAKALKSKNGHKDASLQLLEIIRQFRLGGEQPLFDGDADQGDDGPMFDDSDEGPDHAE